MASESVDEAINILTRILLSLSIAGALATFITFAAFKALRTYPMKLIMYLCITIIFGFLFFLISDSDRVATSSFCKGAAFFIHFFFVANFCWTFCVAFNFYQMIVKRNRETESYEKWYHLFSWGLPSLCCIGAGASSSYGNVAGDLGSSDDFCYITEDVTRFVAFFIPGLVIMCTNALLFFFIAREIHETLESIPSTDSRNRTNEFRVYLSIFVSIGLSWFFGYLLFVTPSYSDASTVFLFLFTLTTPLQGFFVFIAYCVNMRVAVQWIKLFGRCIPACRRWGDELAISSASGSGGRGTGSGAGSSAYVTEERP
mmetsp:Transcript_22794/g.64060  ORF Transcript_22794/g.64060 Transcript_22794/m.64060 type:complete len:314 (+) Transcript_22794:63-1004(+)